MQKPPLQVPVEHWQPVEQAVPAVSVLNATQMPDAQQLLIQVQLFPHTPVRSTAVLLCWQVPLVGAGGEFTQHLFAGGWH